MRISSELKKYLKKRIATINSLLEKPQRLFSPDDYHKLRVDIKQIKALFVVTEFCVKGFESKKQYSLVKPLFKKAGRVRDLQLEMKEMDNYKLYGPFRGYLKWLEETKDKATVEFFSSIDAELRKKIHTVYKSIAQSLDHVHKKEIDNYIDRKKEKIIRLMKRRNSSDEQMHGVRKLLKEFFYTKKMITAKDVPVTKTEELQVMLGKWHDNLVMADHLQKGMELDKVTTTEKKRIRSVKKTVTVNKDLLFKKINEIKPDFLQSFRLQS